MKVKYVGPFDGVEIAETGQVVGNGESVEVDDELGRRLVEQACWVKQAAKKTAEVE